MLAKEHGRIWPISLHQIEATVAAYLGPGRVPGNRQDSAFSRQVAMYLAKHVGRWSTTKIGRFYNGRHHTTVLYAIGKIESLREKDASVDALLELLCKEISLCGDPSQFRPEPQSTTHLELLDHRVSLPSSARAVSDSRVAALSTVTAEPSSMICKPNLSRTP